ncbi:hypothetical protein [Streptomyces sp. C36]|uniref:hypothetical protein n=1 Tax=Streptomyces sp. C36 TaxID=3237122 RepID=UPI0034C6C436
MAVPARAVAGERRGDAEDGQDGAVCQEPGTAGVGGATRQIAMTSPADTAGRAQ